MTTVRPAMLDDAVDDRMPAFPSSSRLPRTVSWRSAVLVAVGAAVLVTVSLGPMSVELGNVSTVVWAATAVIGGLQCALLAELASRFRDRAGGTPQYAYRAVPRGSTTLGALSSWSYWFAWTPGIAVNLVLAATYLRQTAFPTLPVVPTAVGIGVVLYLLSTAGLRAGMRVYAVLAVLVVVPLTLIVMAPLVRHGAFDPSRVLPLELPRSSSGRGFFGTAALVSKWVFVAAWAAYGGEMASTVCAELRGGGRAMARAMTVSAGVCVVAFSVVPVVVLGIVGPGAIRADPSTALVPAARVVFGGAAQTIVGLTLAAALVLGAQAFVVGSSRTVYQLALDGHLPRPFAAVNRRGVPVGSVVLDAVVIAVMLAVFGTRVVEVVAAANVGYLIVFVLLPLAYLVLQRRRDGDPDGVRLPRCFRAVAVALAVLNAGILVVGGSQWGPKVMGIGLGISLSIVPVSWLTRRARPVVVPSWPSPAATGLVELPHPASPAESMRPTGT